MKSTHSLKNRTSARRFQGRAGLLLGSALLPLILAGTAHAQSTEPVILEEGQAPREVHLGTGDDRVVADIGRVNADTGVLDLSGLVTGTLTDAGGLDTLWLRATGSRTANLVFTTPASGTGRQFVTADGTPFDGGIVYEASGNDTELRLENRSRSDPPGANAKMKLNHEPVRLAGDGTIFVGASLDAQDQGGAAATDQKAIYVEPGSTLAQQGGDGDALLTVVIAADMDGRRSDTGLVDVAYAQELRLIDSARVRFQQGLGIAGGSADIFLEANTTVASTDPEMGDVRLIQSSGRVFNSTKITVGSVNGGTTAGGVGVELIGGKLYNTLTENSTRSGVASGGLGIVLASGNAVLASEGANYIENVGRLESVVDATIRNEGQVLVTRNAIRQFANGGSQAGVIAGGTRYIPLTGSLAPTDKLAYQGTGYATDVLVNSGTIEGDVQFADGESMFLYTGATNGVNGQIDGGYGIDGYGKSFGASATYTASNAILSQPGIINFEMHGIEANGADTVVTVASAETLGNGLMAIGDGTVVNSANIDTDGFGVWIRDIEGVGNNIDFVNRGNIRSSEERGVYAETLSSFRNEGSIRTETSLAVLVNAFAKGPGSTFQFTNTGLIENSSAYESAALVLFENQATTELMGDIVNSGTIRTTGHVGPTGDAQYALAVQSRMSYGLGTNYLMRVTNSGTLEATGQGYSGLLLSGHKMEVVNDSLIRGTNAASGGVRFATGTDGPRPRTAASLTNRGTISGGSGAVRDDEFGTTISYGALFDFGAATAGANANVVNLGTIEVGAEGVAIGVDGGNDLEATFTLDNRGTIRGGAGYTLGEEDFLATARLLDDGEYTIAGAIHTRNSTDLITNSGTIIGNIHLGDLGDSFANYGTLNGDLNLGGDHDYYVTGSGAQIIGSVDGGDGIDGIAVDLTGSDAKKLDMSQFRNFEGLTKLQNSFGTGTVSLFGSIDQMSMRLSDIALRIDAGDTIGSASGSTGYTFDNAGADSVESLTNNGTITGGVALGGGGDTLVNTGTIGFDVDMGDGDDNVVNSGTIHGNLNLGAGNDRYEALGGGLVTGAIDGGDGTDTFVFRMHGNSGSIPGGFTNFESFGAYGPGTLTLGLDRNYETIELWEQANLTLLDGTGTVDLIKGDDTAQVVTIQDADFTGGVSLGGGDDTLSIALSGVLRGALDGGSGTDTLNLNLTGAASINDLFGFEIVNAAGVAPLTLTGHLGAGQQMNFDGADSHFIIDTGAVFEGSANGGDGTDTLEINTGAANNRTIVAGQLTSFEKLVAGGAGTLALQGEAYHFQTAQVEGNLSIGTGASLTSSEGVHFGAGDNRLTLHGTGTVGSPVDGGGGTNTLAFELDANNSRSLSTAGTFTNFQQLSTSGTGALVVDRDATYQQVLLEGGTLNIAGGATLAAPVLGNAQVDRLGLAAGATLNGSVNLGGGDDTVNNAGTIHGDVLLGDGDDRYIARSGSTVTGTIDGGAGNNTFIFNLAGANGSIPGSVTNFNSFGVYGPGTLTVNLDQGQTYHNLEILESANLVLSGTNGSVANVIGDDSSQSVTIDGRLTGGVSLGGGDDSLTMHLSGLLQGALDGGAGTDTLNLTLDGASSIAGMFGFEVANVAGTAPLTLAGDLGANQRVNFTGNTDNELIIAAGVKFQGRVDGGAGNDTLRVQSGTADSRTVVASQIVSFEKLISEGAGSLALTGGDYSFDSVTVTGGNFELGANTRLSTATGVTFDGADNRFTLGAGATVAGGVDGGAGNDTLVLHQADNTVRLLSSVHQTGFERLEASGGISGELRIDQNASFANGVGIDGGVFNVTAGNTLTANVAGGANRDIVTVSGRIEGNLDLGAGHDFLTISGAGTITGARNGGDGTDTLIFNTSGTYAAPTLLDPNAYTGFEALNVDGGVISTTGTSSWAAITLTGGRLIGQAGSVITATSGVLIARGATFGTAGTVNGNILVEGTLSPGASPGTMTVNGDVHFFSGSNLLLELSPTASDLLNISGKLVIANGAGIDITGTLRNAPGARLDLVVAQGGITGRFTTINKSNDIFGFVVVNGNRLQLQSEFQNSDTYPLNTRASIAYANATLGAGKSVQTYTAALPALVSATGSVNEQAFAQLTPEAYASVIQLGIENSLSLFDSVSADSAANAGRRGFFAFGRFTGGTADVGGDSYTGAVKTHGSSHGFQGGFGYGLDEDIQVGAFFGGGSSRQTMAWLGARTDWDQLSGGIFADARLGGFGLHGVAALSSGTAETKRQLLAAPTAVKSSYNLKSWLAAGGVDYRLRFGKLAITPRADLIYIHAGREGLSEQGGNGFALNVARLNKNSLFGRASLAVSGSFQAGGVGITPYAELGVQQRLGSGSLSAWGGLQDTTEGLYAFGVERKATAGRAALGLGLDVTPGVRVQGGYTVEFSGTKRQSFTGGLSIRF